MVTSPCLGSRVRGSAAMQPASTPRASCAPRLSPQVLRRSAVHTGLGAPLPRGLPVAGPCTLAAASADAAPPLPAQSTASVSRDQQQVLPEERGSGAALPPVAALALALGRKLAGAAAASRAWWALRGGLQGLVFGMDGARMSLADAATLANLCTVLASTSATNVMKQHVCHPILSNTIFMAGFWGWFIAQFLKIFTARYKKGYWSLKAFTDAGGMPSSHSSLCMSVTMSLAMTEGLGSSMFAMALCFSLIVMYDAAGVRRHAGKQAEVLNVVGKAVLEQEVNLKEVLGHTPFQVVMGALLGSVIGTVYVLCL